MACGRNGLVEGHSVTTPNDSGQAMIEFVLAATVFFLLALGSMDFANLFYHQLTLQNAVRQAGRYAITGQCILGTGGSCSMSRTQSVFQVLETTSNGMITGSNVSSVATMTCTNNGGGCPTQAGGPGDTVTITLTYPYHLVTAPISHFFSGGVYTMTLSASFTNEPFPPSQS
jgi:Flp pilus assembly protein TadG